MSFVDSEGLRDLAAAAQRVGWIGLDVEFNSEKTYHAKLALVQAAVSDVCVLIDPVRDTPDLAPLAEVFCDPKVVKVLHSPDQDLPILVRALGVPARNVFDTQVAAAMAGVGEGAQMGYAWLVQEFTGIELGKAARRTDWLRRPLSADQLTYALDDVRHLDAIRAGLLDKLRDLGRVQWVQEDCMRFEDDDLYRPDPLEAWRKCKGAPGMADPADRAVLQELAAWREDRAERADRPRRWLIDDKALIDLARAQPRPTGADRISDIAGLTDRQSHRWVQEMAAAIQRGAVRTPPTPAGPGRLSKADEAEARRLVEIVKERADELSLPATALATTQDTRAIVLHGRAADTRALTGWRMAEIGERLLAAL